MTTMWSYKIVLDDDDSVCDMPSELFANSDEAMAGADVAAEVLTEEWEGFSERYRWDLYTETDGRTSYVHHGEGFNVYLFEMEVVGSVLAIPLT